MPFMQDVKEVLARVNEGGPDGDLGLLGNLFSALRGPDDENPTLKWLTTARVRAIAFPNFAGGVNLVPLNKKEREERDWLLKNGSHHFSMHWSAAVTAIKILYNYDLQNEVLLDSIVVREENKDEQKIRNR